MPDYLFRGDLAKLDPDVYELTQLEQERQYRKLILIASKSTAPMAVREAALARPCPRKPISKLHVRIKDLRDTGVQSPK